MSDIQISCPRENLLMVLGIACWLPYTTPTELQNHFVFPEEDKWKGVLSATIPCFIAEIGDERHTLTTSAAYFQVKTLPPRYNVEQQVTSGKQRSGA